MKKLFWIPLFVILTVIPMIAGAAPVAGEPVAGNAGSPTATNTPKYALKDAGAGDEKAALASYVKGAYNAVIKGVNKTQDEIDTLNSDIETYSDAIGHLTDGKATKDGTVATIKNATTTESINTSSVNFTGVTTTSISATASGNVDLSIPVMDDWENDAEATNPVQTTTSFTNLAVDNLTMSAPSLNTATLTKTGISGNVDVSGYIASVTPAYDFTPLINTNGDSAGYKSADGNSRNNDAGLSNGEWKVRWYDYGTVLGMAQCSSTRENLTPSTLPDDEGKYCYCKMTYFTGMDGKTMSSLWVRYISYGSAAVCAGNCAMKCGYAVKNDSAFRSRVFGSVQ